MKGTFLISVIVVFSMLAIPLSALDVKKDAILPTVNTQSNIKYEQKDFFEAGEKIKVLKQEKIYEYSVTDYVFGVVAAEMPALYEEEALKAQAVAAYTFLCYKKQTQNDGAYDISADGETAQCFITREEAYTRWGEKAQEYEKRIDNCINAVQGEIMVFDGKPIFAAYHAISSGKTNNCSDVWGSDLPYLKSVDSSGDTQANGYLSQAVFTPKEISEKLSALSASKGEEQTWFKNVTQTDSGYIKSVDFCGKTISGGELRKLLDLRSSNFEVEYKDGNFIFTVKGYGHGVGMSQTGADYLAKQGKSYKEILLHYYIGVTLQKK